MRNANKIISFAVAFQVIVQGCKNILVQGFPFFFNINDSLNIVIMGISLALYVYAFFVSMNYKTPAKTIGVLFFVILTYLFTFAFHSENIKYIEPTILRTIISCFITFFLVSKLTTFDYLYKYFTKGSYLITFSGIVYSAIISIIGHNTTSEWSTYSMTMSNVMLLSVIWQLNGFFDCKKIKLLLAAIIGTSIIFLFGSRNPLLAIVAFVFVKKLFGTNQNKKSGNVALKFLFLLLVLIVVSFFNELLVFLSNTLESFGLESRTIYTLTNTDTVDITSGRSEIHSKLWSIIFENPLIGLGVAGDEASIGELAHSLYLSVFITYGLFLGLIVLLFLLLQSIKGVRNTSGLNHNVIVMYICIVFPRSFTGGDIWINDYLWFLLALIISALAQSRLKKKCKDIR